MIWECKTHLAYRILVYGNLYLKIKLFCLLLWEGICFLANNCWNLSWENGTWTIETRGFKYFWLEPERVVERPCWFYATLLECFLVEGCFMMPTHFIGMLEAISHCRLLLVSLNTNLSSEIISFWLLFLWSPPAKLLFHDPLPK